MSPAFLCNLDVILGLARSLALLRTVSPSIGAEGGTRDLTASSFRAITSVSLDSMSARGRKLT